MRATSATSGAPLPGSPVEQHLTALLDAGRAPTALPTVVAPDEEPWDGHVTAGGAAGGQEPWLVLVESELARPGSLDRVQQLHVLLAQLQALQVRAVADVAARIAPGDPLPEQADGALVVPARAGVDDRVVDELAAGLIDLTSSAARRRVRRLAATADAGAASERVRRQVAGRDVTYAALPDGMASLTAVGPAPQVRGWYERLTAMALDRGRPGADVDPYADLVGARPGGRDGRGLGARRYDGLGEHLERSTTDGPATDQPATGRRAAGGVVPTGRADPLVEISVGVGTLPGADDACAELSGHGPVPAVLARHWAQRSRLRRFFTDPATGLVVGVDGHTYPAGTLPHADEEPGPGAGGADPRRDGPGHGGPGHRGPRGAGGGGSSSCGGPPSGEDATPAAACGSAPDAAPPAAASSRPAAGPCPTAVDGGGRYRAPVQLQRLVRAQLPRCVAPGCSVPASRCDLDHRTPWPVGPTCGCDLHPLCRTHHRMKTLRGWEVRRASDDPRDPTVVWTSPLGREHEVSPESRWVDPVSTRAPRRDAGPAAAAGPAPVPYPPGSADPLAPPPFRGRHPPEVTRRAVRTPTAVTAGAARRRGARRGGRGGVR